MSDSGSHKSKARNRPSEAWASDTVIISDAGEGGGNGNRDVIFGLRNALLVSGLLWAVIVIAGFAIFA